jgi:hypothetical protein
MSSPENLAFMAPLHQVRVSQIPLRPSEHIAANLNARNAFAATSHQDHKTGPVVEMQSSLDHVRYNIVGKCKLLCLNHISVRPDNVENKVASNAGCLSSGSLMP